MIEKLNFKFWSIAFLVALGLMFVPTTSIRMDNVPVPTTKMAKVNIDPKQIHCMAKNIFYEAGSESINGQAAVARVVLNRVAHGFANTPCAVIYQTTNTENGKVCQFSWVCEEKTEPNKNSYKYKVAQQVAYDVMVENKYKDVVPNSALFFHNLTVSPLWPYMEVIRVGNHVFYSKAKKKYVKPKTKNSEIEDDEV